MSVLGHLLNFVLDILKMIYDGLSTKRQERIRFRFDAKFNPVLPVTTEGKTIRFYCPGRLPRWRAETLFSKEPETIEWIDSFGPHSIFWDIGANLGIYSIYAASKPNISVYSFEPSAFNYHLLNHNIFINKMDDRILSFPIAFHEKTQINRFYLADIGVGGALSSFATAVDWRGEEFTPKFRQGMIGFSVDEFIRYFSPKFPNYIKIDVDGIEDMIIRGAAKTLKDRRLKSLLVELDTERKDLYGSIVGLLDEAGFELTGKKHASMFDNTRFSSVYNHIFERSPKRENQ
jgi:FkbM family methyltransferase